MAEKKPKCICARCPSYGKADKLGYCFTGKDKSITEEKGCICPACPVTKEYNLKKVYYCTRGSEKQQTK